LPDAWSGSPSSTFPQGAIRHAQPDHQCWLPGPRGATLVRSPTPVVARWEFVSAEGQANLFAMLKRPEPSPRRLGPPSLRVYVSGMGRPSCRHLFCYGGTGTLEGELSMRLLGLVMAQLVHLGQCDQLAHRVCASRWSARLITPGRTLYAIRRPEKFAIWAGGFRARRGQPSRATRALRVTRLIVIHPREDDDPWFGVGPARGVVP